MLEGVAQNGLALYPARQLLQVLGGRMPSAFEGQLRLAASPPSVSQLQLALRDAHWNAVARSLEEDATKRAGDAVSDIKLHLGGSVAVVYTKYSSRDLRALGDVLGDAADETFESIAELLWPDVLVGFCSPTARCPDAVRCAMRICESWGVPERRVVAIQHSLRRL
jgi:hypothetical protein